MEVLCIDGKFDNETLSIYSKYGVKTPIEESVYNIRSIHRHTTGKIGVLLEQLVNPPVPYKHPIMGEQWSEPTFNILRFSHINQSTILEEELTQLELQPNKNEFIN